jgi:hypothetical protein
MFSYELGVACQDGAGYPYLLRDWVTAESFEKARELFLKDVSVEKNKLNEVVMLLGIGGPNRAI